MKRIWLIGGTSESAALAIALVQAQIPCIVTVTTAAARQLYPASSYLQVLITRFTPETLTTFLEAEAITGILDASHPFAVEISQQAIAAANQFQIPYLRFERQEVQPLETQFGSTANIIDLTGFEPLLTGHYLAQQRVFLTIGSQPLPLFAPWQEKATLFARILPSPQALQVALASGFSSDRLIALRPPISLALERALWQQWQISLVVTKASGPPGGEAIKRQLASELGITLVILRRPTLPYPQQTHEMAIALKFCRQSYIPSQ